MSSGGLQHHETPTERIDALDESTQHSIPVLIGEIQIGEHFEVTCSNDEDLQSLKKIGGIIPGLIGETGWIPELKGNFFYESLVGEVIDPETVPLSPASWQAIFKRQIQEFGGSEADYSEENYQNSLLRKHQYGMFVPYHPNEQKVKEFLEKQANHMAKHLKLDTDAEKHLYFALIDLLRKNLEDFDRRRVIRFSHLPARSGELGSIYREDQVQKNHSPNQVHFSPREIRLYFRHLEEERIAGNKSTENCSLDFLAWVNALPDNEEIGDVYRELENAYNFLRNTLKVVDKAYRKHTKDNPRKEIDINTDLAAEDLYGLLRMMYDPKKREGMDENTLHEAERMLAIFSIFWRVHYHPQQRGRHANKQQLRTALRSVLESTQVKVQMPELTYSKEEGYTLTSHVEKTCYMLEKIDEFEDIQVAVYKQDSDSKKEDPIAKKLTGKNPEKTYEEINDLTRARLFIPEWTSTDVLNDPRKQEYLKRVLKKIATQLHMFHEVKNQDELGPTNPCHYCIRMDLDREYPKVKLVGHDQNGHSYEVQIGFKDTYIFEHAEGSPLDHDEYDETRTLENSLIVLAESIYGEEVVRCIRKELSERKEESKQELAARKEFVSQMAA